MKVASARNLQSQRAVVASRRWHRPATVKASPSISLAVLLYMNENDNFSSANSGPFPSPEWMAIVALDAGQMLMEAGANAKSVDGIMGMIVRGLGAEWVDLRIGYASLVISVGVGGSGITRMRRVGDIGVNQRMVQELWNLGKHVERRELTVEQTSAELARLATETPRHLPWVVALAVGVACVTFGRLLGMDWRGAVPVFLAATIGQYARRRLLGSHVNAFICTVLVAFLCSLVAGLGARWAGSETITIAMFASILMLVPGVPAVNAQSDILDGHPTLGSARVVTVAMTLIFIAAGLWLGQVSLNLWHWT